MASGGVGSRVFNVSINSTSELSNFDVYKDAGGANIADIKEFTFPANTSGQIIIQFTPVTDQAFVSGIEIIPLSVAINSCGPSVGYFAADTNYVGGTCINHANTIDTSKANDPAPSTVYQTARIGAFSYSASGVTAGSNYLVRLHFAETYWTSAGQREFNVSINGTPVLTNFDIYAAAGGQNVACVKEFTTQANSSGINVTFTSVVDNSLLSGIEFYGPTPTSGSGSPDFSISASPSSEMVQAGTQTTYTVTITPENGFNGSVTLSVSGFPSVDTATFNPATLSGGAGNSTLTLSTSASLAYSDSTLTLTGTSGSLTHSTTVGLLVGAAAPLVVTLNSSVANIATELHGTSEYLSDGNAAVSGIPSSTLCPPSFTVPCLYITDGPAGVTHNGPLHGAGFNTTALPAPILLSASWDPGLATTYGQVIGSEAKDLANGLVHGPDINIARTLQNGRAFESFGEDPFLTSQIAVGEIQGIQSQHVISDVKHFAANNQETDRKLVNVTVDERTMREIYLPAFEAAVKQGNAGSIMCAYNQVTIAPNGPSGSAGYMCANSYLLTNVLKQEWGFQGFVLSDYGATHGISTVAAANAGLDLEMPVAFIYDQTDVQNAITANQVTSATLDDKLFRRFETMMSLNVWQNPPAITTVPDNSTTAQTIAEQGMVLLKNSGILPINPSTLVHKKIAVVGPYAGAAMTGGGGSSWISPNVALTAPWQAIQTRSGVTVSYADGHDSTAVSTALQNSDLAIVMIGDAEFENYDDSIALSTNPIVPPFSSIYTNFGNTQVSVDQNWLVSYVWNAQHNTIVVIKSGTGLLLGNSTYNWEPVVPAILEAWYPGERDGEAVAAVLFGDVTPSGKLPLTFLANASDVSPPLWNLTSNFFATNQQYPGQAQYTAGGGQATCTVDNVTENNVSDNGPDSSCNETYSEGLFVGYRYYDQNNITPLFPFGFGLSYTTFSFANLSVSPTTFSFTSNPNQTVTVQFDVKNTGTTWSGADVGELYVGMPSGIGEPPKWLKGFHKTAVLVPGAIEHVTITLNLRSLLTGTCPVTAGRWRPEPTRLW